jgi:Lrp/AsnC family leucine-responsive transcriptional regulator
MDEIDKSILLSLRENARMPLKELSRRACLSLPATGERLRKLERFGYIKKYTAILNPEMFEKEFACFCMVELRGHTASGDDAFMRFVAAHPEILECHRVTGQYEYMLKIVLHSAKEMELLLGELRAVKNIIGTNTFTVLNTLKEDASIVPG